MAEKVRVPEDTADDPELDKLLNGKPILPVCFHVMLLLQMH